jgi:hypothetical protein
VDVRKENDAKYVCEDPHTLWAFWLLLEKSMKAKATCMGAETAGGHGSATLEDIMLELRLSDSIGRTPGVQDIWVIHRQLDNSFMIRVNHFDDFPHCTSLNQADGPFLRGIQNLMTALKDIGIPEVTGNTTWSFDFRGILKDVQGYAFDSCEVLRSSFDLNLLRKRRCMLIR